MLRQAPFCVFGEHRRAAAKKADFQQGIGFKLIGRSPRPARAAAPHKIFL